MIKKRKNCRGCFSPEIKCFLDLGKAPLAGGFLSQDEIKREKKFPLKAYYCQKCGLVQIIDVPEPEILFRNYFYVSSVIKSLSDHFKNYARFLERKYLNKNDAKLLEFGCNDGILLQYLDKSKVYGIDPSKNVSKIAKEKGFKIWTDYFNQKSAKKILEKTGRVDVVTGSNVFAHADDIHEILKAVKIILKKKGVLIIEVHYLKDLLDKFQYDTIYHEHLCYYSVRSLKKIMELEDLKILDVQHLNMHGGSIRVTAAQKDCGLKEKKSVKMFLNNEKNINLKKLNKFGKLCLSHRKKLVSLLKKIKKGKKSIVGYGAPGRGAMLLNYCHIGKEAIDYIVDVSPLRTGKLIPGAHIPIFNLEKARKDVPDYFLVLAWNYADSILKQEEKLIKKGTKFIIPLPKIVIK